MKCLTPLSIPAIAALLIGVILLPGCSGPQEDVRIGFCKNLITTQLMSPRNIEWKESKSKIRRPEYAKITVTFTARSQSSEATPMQADCFYKYATADENVMTQSDPLSAYATVPYKMIMNGETLSEHNLREAVKSAALNQGRALVDRVQKEVSAAAEQVREKLPQ